MRDKIQDITNECIELMKTGVSLEDCLRRFLMMPAPEFGPVS